MNESEAPTQSGGQTEDPRQVIRQQIARQAHAAQSADLADFDEDTGQITPRADDQSAEPEQESPEVAAPESVSQPAPAKMLTIIVDGQPIEVEESRIIEAGKRTLQKDNAADRRLQEAAQLKRAYESRLEQLQRLSGNPDATQQAPSQDAPSSQQATVDPSALDAYLESKLYNREATKAVGTFVSEYRDIAEDPYLMAIAIRLEDQRIATAAQLGEPLGDPAEAYRKHGQQIRQWMQQKAGATPAAADKRELKRQITTIPTASARAPKPAEERVLTPSEKIEQMRLARLQGRPVAQRH